MNAANEMAVQSIFEEGIAFNEIATIVEKVMAHHIIVNNPRLQDILEADRWAREYCQEFI